MTERKWWKEAVVYQIYPRSFCDSNGDGIGDIRGIISKLDYLKNLGVDVLWLCPVYKSPNDDNGYDISDYRTIMDEFGTMEDFMELLRETHLRGMKLIMDLVVNHTSDEHPWFIESRSSKENDKRGYYIWRKGINGHEPNNWASFFTPSAWKYDDVTGEYYLHLFSEKQPDLNWENRQVREEVYAIMKWWLDKGIDGFRMDVINCISKAEGLPSVPVSGGEDPYAYKWGGQYFQNGPRIHEFLHEMYLNVLSKYDIMTVGETPNVTPDDAELYAGFDRGELCMVFQFELMEIDSGVNGKWDIKPYDFRRFKEIIEKWQTRLDGKAWNSLYLDNHDQPRALSRFGNDAKYRVESAKLLATLLLTLQGTPYIYQGDEIGMTNVRFDDISDYRDIETLEFFKAAMRGGISTADVMNSIYAKSRDNARTPMQWNAGKNAGFTSGTPWIKINPNYHEINVEQSICDKNSIFNYYASMIRLRKQSPELVYGHFEQILKSDERIFAYKRTLDDNVMLVILNFSDAETTFELPLEFAGREFTLAAGNYQTAPDISTRTVSFRPYEAAVYKIR